MPRGRGGCNPRCDRQGLALICPVPLVLGKSGQGAAVTFIIENQFPLLILFFLAGCAGTAMLFRKPAGHRAWRLADLVWVVLGGFGALAAVLAGIYSADSSRIERQVDIAFAATTAFDQDAARFRLTYCEAPADPQVMVLCDKADFLSASTAENAELPLFLAVTSAVSPLSRLSLFVGGDAPDQGDMASMVEQADRFDTAPLLAFAALDERTEAATAALRDRKPAVAANFQILAQSYETLIAQVGTLKQEWEFLQANSGILVLQIIALCLVSFAAPFRLGKSIVEVLS